MAIIMPAAPQLGSSNASLDSNAPVPSGLGGAPSTPSPGISSSPNVDISSLLNTVSIPPDIDPTEGQHLAIAAGVLASHINQGQIAFADAAKIMKNMVQSVRTLPVANGAPQSAPMASGSSGTPTAATPFPGTGSLQLPPSSLPTPAPPATSPTGRTFSDIQASGKYQSLAEREWYLNQINRTVGRNGLPVPRPSLPDPSTTAGTSFDPSSGGSGMFGNGGEPSITPPSTGSGGLLDTLPDGSAMVPDYAHPGSTPAHLSQAQVNAIRTIFPPSEWTFAMEVAAAESGGNNNATGSAGERGIFQIHPVNFRTLGVDSQALQDPFRSTEAAYKLWEESGWAPWTTAPLIRAATARQH